LHGLARAVVDSAGLFVDGRFPDVATSAAFRERKDDLIAAAPRDPEPSDRTVLIDLFEVLVRDGNETQRRMIEIDRRRLFATLALLVEKTPDLARAFGLNESTRSLLVFEPKKRKPASKRRKPHEIK